MCRRSVPSPPHDDPEQSKRFIEAAIAAEPDETGEAFAKAFKTVARRKDQKAEPKKP